MEPLLTDITLKPLLEMQNRVLLKCAAGLEAHSTSLEITAERLLFCVVFYFMRESLDAGLEGDEAKLTFPAICRTV